MGHLAAREAKRQTAEGRTVNLEVMGADNPGKESEKRLAPKAGH